MACPTAAEKSEARKRGPFSASLSEGAGRGFGASLWEEAGPVPLGKFMRERKTAGLERPGICTSLNLNSEWRLSQRAYWWLRVRCCWN